MRIEYEMFLQLIDEVVANRRFLKTGTSTTDHINEASMFSLRAPSLKNEKERYLEDAFGTDS